MSSEGAKAFIARWAAASASERANSQPFLCELCNMLGVATPEPTRETGYAFEYDVIEHHPDGSTTKGRIDLYKRACFVLESKQFQAAKVAASQLEMAAQEAGVIEKKKSSQPVRGTGAWDDAMIKARGQAERYVRALPPSEPNPPFLVVVDVGHSFEVFADFTQAGKAYLPFPDPRTFRIRLEHLADEKVRERLKLIWTQPTALDPALQSADVTREISAHLAELAKSLEGAGHRPRVVADFLTRCLFCMFAEDVGLLPNQIFTKLATASVAHPESFEANARQLFAGMAKGGDVAFEVIDWFNGGLFDDDATLPLDEAELKIVLKCAALDWSNIEPSIFGTLFERGLDPDKRSQQGAHYTDPDTIMKIVGPVVLEPWQREWEAERAEIAKTVLCGAAAVHGSVAWMAPQHADGLTRVGLDLGESIGR
jgi:hypothetical protein